MMIVAAWLVYCAVLSAVLTAGALAWERSARWSGRPARWAWLGALAGSVVLPWLLRVVPERALPEVVPTVLSSALSPVFLLPPPGPEATSVPLQAAAAGWTAAEVAVAGWLVLSLAMLGLLVRVLVVVTRARRGWRREVLDGAPVYVTRNIGPACMGLRRGVIVLPGWVLGLPATVRALLLLHEREHVRAGDPRLVLAGLLLLAAMPWNPIVWFQLLRLRNAIELDCDARVLASGADPRLYGSLLLEVGSRRGGHPLVMATFAEPRVFLEERIRRIAAWPLKRRRGRSTAFALTALALFATALSARDPLRPPVLLGNPLGAGEAADGRADQPRRTLPELANPWDVQDSLVAHYPDLLQRAGLGGVVTVWVRIDAAGTVDSVRLSGSAGYPALDEAALRVAPLMRFTPARENDVPITTWVEVPLVFGPSDSDAASRPLRAADDTDDRVFVVTAEEGPQGDGRPRPAVPADQQPELANTAEVLQALLASYPQDLRSAGIGGVSVVWFFIDTDGRVLRTQVGSSSGHASLDDAALGVASLMRFRPLVRDGQATQTWVEIPFVFGPGQRLPAPQRREGLIALPALIVTPSDMSVPGSAPTRLPYPPAPPRDLDDLAREPTFTPMTVRPELQNAADVQRALITSYPPVLRDAGISGTPVVWFFLDDTGRVQRTQLSRSSGYPALDQAALNVAAQMRFSAALNRDRAVPVWIEIPIRFTAR